MMPCQPRALSVMAYAQGFTLWHYAATGVPASRLIDDARFFAPARDRLRPGDVILATGPGGGALRVVVDADGGVAPLDGVAR